MNKSDFDNLLVSLNDEAKWLHRGAFAGQSEAILSFVRELDDAGFRSCDPLKPWIVLFNRPSECRRIDDAVVASLKFSASSIINLYQGSNEHNHGLLFGSGTALSIFERNEQRLVVTGCHFLCNFGWSRLLKHLNVWLPMVPKAILLIGHSLHIDPENDRFLTGITTELSYPDLTTRPSDVVFELHMAAKACGGGLDQFSFDAFNVLAKRTWPHGERELERVVQLIYRELGDRKDIEVELVQTCLKLPIGSRVSPQRANFSNEVWPAILRLREDIDQMTTSLIGSPFFIQRAETSTQRPLGSSCPELDFFRLVSWSYMMLVECGGTNVASLVKLAGGLQSRCDRIAEGRESVVRLRTFLQHSLQYSSKSDKMTIELTSRWFDSAVGCVCPRSQDFEICTAKLLHEVKAVFDDIHRFLRRLNEDEYKFVIIRQWKDRIEDVWPRYEFDRIVEQAVSELGRDDLDPQAVSKKLISKLQDRLKVISRANDPRAIVLEYAKGLLSTQFPTRH